MKIFFGNCKLQLIIKCNRKICVFTDRKIFFILIIFEPRIIYKIHSILLTWLWPTRYEAGSTSTDSSISSTALRSSATGLPGRDVESFDKSAKRLRNSPNGMYFGKPTLWSRTASKIWLPLTYKKFCFRFYKIIIQWHCAFLKLWLSTIKIYSFLLKSQVLKNFFYLRSSLPMEQSFEKLKEIKSY